MSEWLLHCTDDLKSGAYYASVDICDGEQPTFILFKKDGDKTIVVGQGEPINPHGKLADIDALIYRIPIVNYEVYENIRTLLESAPATILASEEVYGNGYDTAGNYHFCGTRTGEHVVMKEGGNT